jgi:serine/threonine protein kinase
LALAIGTQIGSHEITAILGKGGMGEVYRARDSKLKREVAIKILPEEFSRDPDRVSRFQREAEVLASLKYTASKRRTMCVASSWNWSRARRWQTD